MSVSIEMSVAEAREFFEKAISENPKVASQNVTIIFGEEWQPYFEMIESNFPQLILHNLENNLINPFKRNNIKE